MMKGLSDDGWNAFRKNLFSVDLVTLKNLKRFLLMLGPVDDYQTMMDLVDTHPELFAEPGYFISSKKDPSKKN